jgi:cell division protein FtsA
MSRSMLVSIIGPRVEEIFTMARDELKKARVLDSIGAGVVLTGGGASMAGMTEIAEEIFALPVRVGAPRESLPHNDLALGPKFATAVGLVHYAQSQIRSGEKSENDAHSWAGRTTGRVKKWFAEIF